MRTWAVRCLGLVVAFVLLGACTSGGGDDSSVTTTSTPPASTSTTAAIVIPAPDVTATTQAPSDAGLSASSVFEAGIGQGFELIELDEDAARTVREQFTADERFDDVVLDADVRVAQLDGADVAAVAAVAVSPTVALSESWRTEFEAGLTEGAISAVDEVRIATEMLLSFSTPGADPSVPNESLLWRHDNVFVLITGRDEEVVFDVAFAVLDEVVGPIPTTTTAPPTTLTQP
ncbi:MAG: hypothetical protein AAFZ07_15785 [Actinomycetota bacterium]